MSNTDQYPTLAEEREACWKAVREAQWITHDDLPLTISQALDAQAQRVAALTARVEQAEAEALASARQAHASKEEARGYRCFHCRFVFYDDDGSASEHFGKSSGDTPKCVTARAESGVMADDLKARLREAVGRYQPGVGETCREAAARAEALEQALRDEVPVIVRRAVENYCTHPAVEGQERCYCDDIVDEAERELSALLARPEADRKEQR